VVAGATVLRRELTIGGGHSGGQLGWVHFGLGSADHAEIRVRWPDGTVSPAATVAGDTFTIIDRSSGARTWRPGAGL